MQNLLSASTMPPVKTSTQQGFIHRTIKSTLYTFWLCKWGVRKMNKFQGEGWVQLPRDFIINMPKSEKFWNLRSVWYWTFPEEGQPAVLTHPGDDEAGTGLRRKPRAWSFDCPDSHGVLSLQFPVQQQPQHSNKHVIRKHTGVEQGVLRADGGKALATLPEVASSPPSP